MPLIRAAVIAAACAAIVILAAGPGGAQDRPPRGGTLVVALAADPGHLNPAITTSGATHAAAELVFNGLVGRDERGEPQPELADSWRIEQNGAVYRFRLREGVVWHDGKPLTSADVKFTFDELLLKYHARTKASLGAALAGIETPDDRTVVFRFTRPYAPLLLQLDVTEAPILPGHVFQGAGDPLRHPANAAPVGTGPFRVVRYTRGAEIRFARHPAYFRPDLPYLDAVVMRVIPDVGTQVLALESGEVDFLWAVPGPHRARLAADGRFRLAQTSYHPGGSNCIMTVSFNLERPALRDTRVRRAIAHAVDRGPILGQILFGEGRVATAPISSELGWAHAAGLALPRFDRGEAERLLQAAGWQESRDGARVARGVAGVADGTRLALDFLHFPAFTKYGELLRQQLGTVGIALAPKPLEPAAFAPVVFRDRTFDTNLISYCNGPDPEIGVRRMYHSSQIGSAPFTNAAAYRNPRVDALFDEAARTIDRAARGRLYREMQEIVAQDLPYLWLVETPTTRAWTARCGGLRPWTGHFAEAAHCRP